MTAQRGYISARASKDQLGVHSLDHFALSVPDLKIAKNYFADFGLDVRERDEALHLKTYGSDHT